MEESVKDTGEPEHVEDQAEDLEDTENISEDQTDDQEDQVDSPTSGTASEDVEESEEVEEDPEIYQETVVLDAPAADYVQQLDNITSLLLFLIFFIGIGCGLISARIMWGRVK